MFGSVVHRGLHDHAAAARIGAIDRVIPDDAPFACRPPILRKIAKGVIGIFRGMLFPVRVLIPDGVSALNILMRQGRKKLTGDVAFGIVAQMIRNPYQDDCPNNGNNDQVSATAGARLVELLRIHERHDLSIIEIARNMAAQFPRAAFASGLYSAPPLPAINYPRVCTSTLSTAGKSRTMGFQLSPASLEAYTWPPVVPK